MTAKTDRELLELAAKAAGYDTSHPMNTERLSLDPPVDALWVSAGGKLAHTGWNPLANDGDALRLAVKLSILVDPESIGGATTCVVPRIFYDDVPHGDDPCAATRRAIVRAAAAIGETL